MMDPSGIMFHRGFNVPLGSFALCIKFLRAIWLFEFTITEFLSPNVLLIFSVVMRMGEIRLRFCVVPMCLLASSWLSGSVSQLVRVLYCASIWVSESDSWLQMAASFSIALFSFFLSKLVFFL